MMIVLALGISSPDSIIVVQTSRSSLPVDELQHHPLQLMGRQLAVGDPDADLGRIFLR